MFTKNLKKILQKEPCLYCAAEIDDNEKVIK